MQTINVLTITRLTDAERARVEATDPAIRLTDAGGWYDGEIRETWPASPRSGTSAATPTARGRAQSATGCLPRPR